MKDFMNKLWTAKGSAVTGEHNGRMFGGKILSTRAKFGTDIEVRVAANFDDNFETRNLLIDGTDLFHGDAGVFTNLKVHFIDR
jgi:hypothetical protein